MSVKELSVGDERWIEEYLLSYDCEECQYKLWIEGSVNDAKKLKEKLLIICKYRGILVYRGALGKKSVEKEWTFFDLQEIAVEDNILNLRLVDCNIYIKSPFLVEIIHNIRISHRRLAFGIDTTVLTTKVPQQLLRDIGEHTIGACGGFEDSYIAQCNSTKARVSLDFVNYIRELSGHTTELDLYNFPAAIDTKGDTLFDVNGVFAALITNTYFKSLIVRNVPLPKNGTAVCLMLRHNKTLEKLVLENVETNLMGIPIPGGGFDWAMFADAVISNKSNNLRFLNFSSNDITVKAMTSLAPGIQSFVHSLKVLNLSHCGMKPQAIVLLFEALEKNFDTSLSIEELDLSWNFFDIIGSQAFGNWLQKARDSSFLRILRLGSSGLLVNYILEPLTSLMMLETLDLSGLVIEKEATSVFFRNMFSESTTLRSVDFSRCKAPGEFFEEVYTAAVNNTRIKDFEMILTEMERIEVPNIAKIFSSCSFQMSVLDLAGNKLRGSGVVAILQVLMVSCKSLNELRIGRNLGKDVGEAEEACKCLIEFVESVKSLKKLSLAGDKTSKFRKGLFPFLSYLAKNKTIEELDINHNAICNSGLSVLGEALKKNSTLKKVKIDKNKITITGYSSLRFALKYNTTLQNIPFPHQDFGLASAALSPDRKKQLHDIYNEIEYILKNNAKNIVTERPVPTIVQEVQKSITDTTTTTTTTAVVVPPIAIPKNDSFTTNTSPRENVSASSSSEKPPTPKTPTTTTETKSTTPTSSSSTPNSDFNFFDVSFPAPSVTPTATTTKADPSSSFSNFFENPFITPTNSTNVTPTTSTTSVVDSPSVTPANTTTTPANTTTTPANTTATPTVDNAEPPKSAPAPAANPVREMYKAIYDYTAVEPNEITFKAGDVIRLVKKYKDTEWCKGELRGKVGFFPLNYCELVKN